MTTPKSCSKSFFVYNPDALTLQPGLLCAMAEKLGKERRRRREKKKGKEGQRLSLLKYFLSALVGVELQ